MGIKKQFNRLPWAVVTPKEITVVLPAKYMWKRLSEEQIHDLVSELLITADQRIQALRTL